MALILYLVEEFALFEIITIYSLLQCWLSVVQGNIVTTQTEAIKVSLHSFIESLLHFSLFHSARNE